MSFGHSCWLASSGMWGLGTPALGQKMPLGISLQSCIQPVQQFVHIKSALKDVIGSKSLLSCEVIVAVDYLEGNGVVKLLCSSE